MQIWAEPLQTLDCLWVPVLNLFSLATWIRAIKVEQVPGRTPSSKHTYLCQHERAPCSLAQHKSSAPHPSHAGFPRAQGRSNFQKPQNFSENA